MEKRFAATLALAVVLTAVCSSLATYAVLQMSARVSSVAVVKTVGISVYQDQALTQPLTQIDWGILEPGQSKNFTAYVKNTANVPVNLSIVTENWNPPAAQPQVTITWDYSSTPINPNAAIKVLFTLKVSNTITGIATFSAR